MSPPGRPDGLFRNGTFVLTSMPSPGEAGDLVIAHNGGAGPFLHASSTNRAGPGDAPSLLVKDDLASGEGRIDTTTAAEP